MEQWKSVEGYEERYQISDHGNIFLKTKQKLCNLGTHIKGYSCIKLYKNGVEKMFTVHRLVAKAFIANPDNKPCVNHIDGNKKNNHISNLEWCTRAENNKHASENNLVSNGTDRWNAKLDEEKVREIRKLRSQGFIYREIASMTNSNIGMVGEVIRGSTWKHIK